MDDPRTAQMYRIIIQLPTIIPKIIDGKHDIYNLEFDMLDLCTVTM